MTVTEATRLTISERQGMRATRASRDSAALGDLVVEL